MPIIPVTNSFCPTDCFNTPILHVKKTFLFYLRFRAEFQLICLPIVSQRTIAPRTTLTPARHNIATCQHPVIRFEIVTYKITWIDCNSLANPRALKRVVLLCFSGVINIWGVFNKEFGLAFNKMLTRVTFGIWFYASKLLGIFSCHSARSSNVHSAQFFLYSVLFVTVRWSYITSHLGKIVSYFKQFFCVCDETITSLALSHIHLQFMYNNNEHKHNNKQ
jgi:hypothetical protein